MPRPPSDPDPLDEVTSPPRGSPEKGSMRPHVVAADAIRWVSRPVESTLRGAARRVYDLVKYRLERFLLGGTVFRLLFIAAVIGVASIVGGLAVLGTGPETVGEAVWWAFLRLTDPGYLGDDEGTQRRVISTFLTVLGYVLFMGALVAILTTSLNQAINRLETGTTPIALSGHLLVIGANSRTPTILRELLDSEDRVRRFLALHRTRQLRVVLLADDVTSRLRRELQDRLGTSWRSRQVVLRSGTPLRVSHLARVDFAHASAIILPGDARQPGGTRQADAATIKSVLAMSTYAESLTGAPPTVVCEVFDGRKARIARQAYRGGRIDVVATDELVASLLAQNIRHPGLSQVYADLLTHTAGSALFIREAPTLAGVGFAEARARFPRGILIGVVRPEVDGYDAILAPGPAFRTADGDRYVLVARSYEDTRPEEKAAPPGSGDTTDGPPAPVPAAAVGTGGRRRRRLLVLGFNHKVPALLAELDRHDAEDTEVVLMSAEPKPERREWMRGRRSFSRLTLDWRRGDRTVPADLSKQDPRSFDTVVLTSSDAYETAAEADADTVVSYLLLRDLLGEPDEDGAIRSPRPRVLVELMDAPNRMLFAHEDAEVLVSPTVVGRVLAHITIRRELRPVYAELLGPRGAEFAFRSPEAYGLDRGTGRSFRALETVAAAHGDVLVGIHDARGPRGGRAFLHPGRDTPWPLDAGQSLIVVRERRLAAAEDDAEDPPSDDDAAAATAAG